MLSGQAASLVVHDGETVIGSGTVELFRKGPARLCVLDAAPYGRQPKRCEGVDLVGFDPARLNHRVTEKGYLAGAATVVGIYRHGTLTVTAQGPPAPVSPAARPQFVPCTPPSGGWDHNNYGSDATFMPFSVDLSAARHYQRMHPEDVVAVAALRASMSSVVAYALTPGAPNRVRAALSKFYPKELCVTRSRFTPAQLTAAQAALQSELVGMPGADGLPAWLELGSAGELGPDAQLAIPVEIPIMTPRLARLFDAQAPGVVRITTILRPLHQH